MANITILSTPAQGLTYRMVPVYNGLPFVVNSLDRDRINFKYIADVYVSGTLVATLKQNKDISNQSYGIFDIGRIVENYIQTTRDNLTTYGFTSNVDAYKSYQVKFGVEYERYLKITSITLAVAEYTRITFETIHDLRVGDYITIQGTANYNYKSKVTSISTNSVVTDMYWTVDESGTGTATEAEGFYDNVLVQASGNYVGWAIPVTRPTRIKVGDRVVIEQDSFPIAPTIQGYNGEWLVTKIFTQNISGTDYQVIQTDCPYLYDTPVNGGMIYPISKSQFKDITTSVVEYAWDAALQYKEFLSYNPITYSMNTTNLGQFLTSSPRNLKIRRDELATLSFLHTSIMGSSATKMQVTSYDVNNNVLDTISFAIPSIVNTYGRLDVAAGPVQLEALPYFTLVGATKYELVLTNSSSVAVSETLTYTIDDSCYRYSQKRLKWKNRLGGWDYFTFNLRSDKTLSIERSNFNKFTKRVNSSNNYTYSVGDRGRTTYNVKAIESETLQSNWLTQGELTWLEEAFTSPDVYIMDGVYEIPVLITNEEFKVGEKENRGLMAYTINIEYAHNKLIQRN